MTKVLLVEDSSTQREIISGFLKESGFHVIVANDGVEARERIEEHCPDLVLLDIVMPRMNGYEFCRWIKSNPDTKHIAVVMCSTKNEEFDRYWGMKQGADAYISKPFEPAELVKVVQRLLGT